MLQLQFHFQFQIQLQFVSPSPWIGEPGGKIVVFQHVQINICVVGRFRVYRDARSSFTQSPVRGLWCQDHQCMYTCLIGHRVRNFSVELILIRPTTSVPSRQERTITRRCRRQRKFLQHPVVLAPGCCPYLFCPKCWRRFLHVGFFCFVHECSDYYGFLGYCLLHFTAEECKGPLSWSTGRAVSSF